MKRLIRWAAALYPRAWRERYRDEFEALIEDSRGDVRDLLDVLFGAMKMQAMRGSYTKFAMVAAALGLIVAGVIVLRMPQRYVATMVLRSTAPDLDQRLRDVTTRSTLTELIQRPALGLYPEERQRVPIADVVALMQYRDLHLQKTSDGVRISFSYPDKEKAKAVVEGIKSRLIEGNISAYQRSQQSRTEPSAALPPAPTVFYLVSQTTTSERVNRWPLLAAGTLLGMIVGLISAATVRHRSGARRVFAFAFAGAVVAIIVAFQLPDQFVSNAVLRMTAVGAPDAAAASVSSEERLRSLLTSVFTDESLANIIQRPSLQLYPEAAGRPIPERVAKMKRDIRVQLVSDRTVFMISFQYPDHSKAQAVVSELVTRFIEENLNVSRAGIQPPPPGDPATMAQGSRTGVNLEVLDPPSYPYAPSWPNRWTMAFTGLLVGALLAALTMMYQHWRTPRERVA